MKPVFDHNNSIRKNTDQPYREERKLHKNRFRLQKIPTTTLCKFIDESNIMHTEESLPSPGRSSNSSDNKHIINIETT